MAKSKPTIIDDGFNARLVETATFAGLLEIPTIKKPDRFIVPTAMIPFTKMKQSNNHSEALVFYEHDIRFRDLLTAVDDYIEELSKFPVIVSPDCSLYVDMPLVLQMANTYLSRQIGHYLQSKGLYVIPNVRWGDERSYTRTIPTEVPFAFLGVEKHSIVSIGTYGCSKTREEVHHLREGLRAMLKELEPEMILVYGSMPDSVFKEFQDKTQFVHYPDWTSARHGRG